MKRTIRSGLTVLTAALCLAVLGSSALAREATLTTKEGKQYTGDLIGEDATTYTIIISDIHTPIKKEDVAKIEYKKSLADEFAERKAALAPDRPDDWVALDQWAYESKEYGLAKDFAKEIQTKFKGNAKAENAIRKASLISQMADADQAKLDASTGATPTNTTVTNPKPAVIRPKVDHPDAQAADRLTADQINTLRILHIDPNDQPRITIKKEAIDRIFSDYRDRDSVPKGKDQDAFRALPGYEQIKLIFNLRARELWPMITVNDDPTIFKDFGGMGEAKMNIHKNYVLSYCGTALCHGGDKGGNLKLITYAPTTIPTIYTNYFILYNYFDASKGYIIDADNPEKSLLLQYALRQDIAKTPHPAVKGWTAYPPFNMQNFQDQQPYIHVLDWIKSLGAPRFDKDYQTIGYIPPVGTIDGSTTKPSNSSSTTTPPVQPKATPVSTPR